VVAVDELFAGFVSVPAKVAEPVEENELAGPATVGVATHGAPDP